MGWSPRAAVLLLVLFVPGRAVGDPLPRHRVHHDNVLVGRVNPWGARDEYRLGYRRALATEPSLLLADTHVGALAMVTPTPGLIRGGLAVELKPLAILEVFAAVEGVQYFGVYEYLLSFPTAATDYRDSVLERAADEGRAYAGSGWLLSFGGKLQAALPLGPARLAVRGTLRAQRAWMATRNRDPVYYDAAFDLLAPAQGWVVTEDADVLVQWRGWTWGVRHTLVHAFYTERMFDSWDDPAAAHPTTHRLGPVLAYRFFDLGPAAVEPFNRPTLALLVQWWLDHPYRTGRESHAGLPMIALAFAFEGLVWAR